MTLIGAVHGVHTVYPILLEQGFGHIVKTASMAGQVPCPGLTAYAATNSHGCGRPWQIHGATILLTACARK